MVEDVDNPKNTQSRATTSYMIIGALVVIIVALILVILSFHSSLVNMQQTLISVNQTITSLNSHINTQNSTILSLNNQINKDKTTINNASLLLVNASNKISTLQDQVTKLQSEINSTYSYSCVAIPGFTCQVPSYNLTTDQLRVVVGQNSGTNWQAVKIYFIPSSEEPSVEASGLPPNLPYGSVSGGLASGITGTVNLPDTTLSQNGYIWISYTPSGNSASTVEAQIASVDVT
jgi:hypothetical protein